MFVPPLLPSLRPPTPPYRRYTLARYPGILKFGMTTGLAKLKLGISQAGQIWGNSGMESPRSGALKYGVPRATIKVRLVSCQ